MECKSHNILNKHFKIKCNMDLHKWDKNLKDLDNL